MNKKKSEGFSLYTVIVFILLITSIFIFMLFLEFYKNKTTITSNKTFHEYLNLRSAISKFISDSKDCFPPIDSAAYVIFNDTIYVKRQNNLLLTELIAYNKLYTHRLKAELGNKPDSYFTNALTISKKNSRLVEAGNIKIKGKIAVDNIKIKKRNIPGISTHHKFIDKKKLDEKKDLPLRLYKNVNFDSLFFQNNLSEFEVIKGNVRISNLQNFSSRYIRIEGNLTVDENYSEKIIEKLFVSGEVILKHCDELNIKNIISDSLITINNCTQLKKINFIAKKNILVKNSNYFRKVSLLSTNNINISNSIFHYPSFVAIQRDTLKKKKNTIVLDKTLFNGTISLFTNLPGNKDNSFIHIKPNSTVKGFIYSEAKTELSGKLIGSIFTHQIRKYVKPTEYINWLADLNIDNSKSPKNFLLPAIMQNKNQYYIIDETLEKIYK